MKKIILSAAAALVLAGCGSVEAGEQSLANAAAAIDGEALVEAVDGSVDRNAVEGLARGAVAGAVREAIPAEVRAVGAVVDEQALARGVGQAIDSNALGAAVKGAVESGGEAAEK